MYCPLNFEIKASIHHMEELVLELRSMMVDKTYLKGQHTF